jgi:cyclophilin family peptidyl-prolyl cis-trans isomerase
MSKKQQNNGGFSKRKAVEAEEKRKKQRLRRIYTILGIVGLVVIAAATFAIVRSNLADEPVEATGTVIESDRALAALDPQERNGYFDQAPGMVIDTDANYEAVIETPKGAMRVKLFADLAPETVNNFVFLANQGFYDGTTFHRVLEDFMAQAGDPSGTGSGGPGYQFGDETDNGLTFDKPGLLAMANAGPGTNGSQFFITYEPTPWLDGGHTIFGELIEGQDVLDSIRLRDPQRDPEPGDLIEAIIIEKS